MTTIQLDTFSKLPFGGVSPKLMAQRLAAEGPAVAAADLDRARSALRPGGLSLPAGSAVLMLGGSGGILRALAIQLLFGERVPVYAIHYDSEKLQIGSHHARALMAAAAQDGVACHYVNADATRPDNVQKVVDRIVADGHRCVHLINGIAAGATKRFAEHGTAKVRDLDIAFDPLRQIADFSSWSSLRQFGLVDVDIATEADIERTYKFMGHSTDPWAEALERAGLLIPRESVVAFTDYDYEHDDPVYALGPLSQAKVLQRQSMQRIQERTGVRTVRLCYPAMNTTALGAIPGGTLMFAGTAQILLEQKVYQSIPDLARASLPVFNTSFDQPDLRVDLDFQRVLPEFHRRKVLMHSGNMRENFSLVFENPALLASEAGCQETIRGGSCGGGRGAGNDSGRIVRGRERCRKRFGADRAGATAGRPSTPPGGDAMWGDPSGGRRGGGPASRPPRPPGRTGARGAPRAPRSKKPRPTGASKRPARRPPGPAAALATAG